MNHEHTNETNDEVADIVDMQQRIQQAKERHPAFMHQNNQIPSAQSLERDDWEDTVGSHESPNLDELTDDQVLAMHNQGRGGDAIAMRAERILHTVGQLEGVQKSIARHEGELATLNEQLEKAIKSGNIQAATKLRTRIDLVKNTVAGRGEQTDNLNSELNQ